MSRILDYVILHFGRILPDKPYLSLRYRCLMGKWIDWKSPKTFTEKIQWLKLYNRKPEYTTMVDKYAVKQFVAERIGEEYIIPTLGVWNKPEDIDWDSLPDKFVLKTTHGGGSGGVVICSDINKFDKQAAIDKLNASLRSDIYASFREWPYKNVPKRIIAEKFMAPKKTGVDNFDELKDYKFFCFDGKVKFFKVDFDRFIEHHANYYSVDGSLLPFGEKDCLPQFDKHIELPHNLRDMINLAEKLSVGFPFLRVDLYNVTGHIYFGELTFFPASGMGAFVPESWDRKIGYMLDI